VKNEPRKISAERKTKETSVILELEVPRSRDINLSIEGVPFFEHLLNAFAFHGNMGLVVKAAGDVEIDQHHLVEDLGLVLGDAVFRYIETYGPVKRFGHAVIPMDDSLAEAAVDLSGRPYLRFEVDFPQDYLGSLPACLLEEFWYAFATRSRSTIHLIGRYGRNSHHLAEAMFKAAGKGFEAALAPVSDTGGVRSTKGTLSD
jgi:imidazoleglycerol-phosphate dehydratase